MAAPPAARASCWLAGRGLALDSVIFPYRRPAHADDYALIFTENSRFAPTLASGVGTLVASFNANLLDLPDPPRRSRPGRLPRRRARQDHHALPARPRNGHPHPRPAARRAAGHAQPRRHRRPPAPLATHHPPPPGRRRVQLSRIKDALRRDMALARLTKTKDSIARSPPISAMPTPRPFIGPLSNGPGWRRCITGANGRTNWPARIDDVPTSPQSRPTSWRP
jgi:hypothetical protein